MISIFEPKVIESTNDLLKDIFADNWLGRGKDVEAFEQALSDYLKVERHKIFTLSSCTDAIFGALKIFDLPPGAEIIMPSNSFIAVGSAVVDAGLTPRIVDIDPLSGNISLTALQSALSQKTAGVFVTDYGGIPVDIAAIRSLVGPNIRIFQDCAGSLGSFVGGQASGALADYACWSFDPMKVITSGEGGAIFVKDSEYGKKAREFFFHGLPQDEQSGDARSKKNRKWWEHQLRCHGRRSMFTNINAAIGLPQLRQIDEFLERRSVIRAAYMAAIQPLKTLSFLPQDGGRDILYSNYFFTVKSAQRDALAFFLKDNGVYSTFKYYPLHKIDLFRKFSQSCPAAEEFSAQALNIPVHQYLSDSDVSTIIQLLSEFDSRQSQVL